MKGIDVLHRFFLIVAVGVLGALAAPAPGLLTELRFDEPAGAAAQDRSGRSPGVLQHAVRSPGRLGGGLLLNGRNAWVEIPGHASVHPPAYTMRLWVRLRALPRTHNQGWIVLRNRGGDFYEFALKVVTRGGPCFAARVENGSDEQAVEVRSTVAPRIGRWQLLTVTFGEGRLCLYVDGKLAAEGTRPGLVPPRLASPLVLGSGWGSFLAGEIDEFQLAPRAWSAAEVAANHRADLADKRPAPKLPESFWLEAEDFSGGWIRASDLWCPKGAPTGFSGN
ncbi:MAG: LamG domain-containing protein, partial [Victivallales bacterium]|nr:LamG domain-containing protein [Victivallales bacterium]